MSINPTNRDPHKETTMTNTNAATAPAWEFGGMSIASTSPTPTFPAARQ